MIVKKKTGGRVLLSLLLLISLIFTAVPANAKSAVVSGKKAANLENNIQSGVYRIRNAETGLYIDAYDFAYDHTGSAYMEEKNGGEAQDIYVNRLSDGTYVLTPQSEGGVYSLSYSEISGLRRITKKKFEENSKTERFVIYASEGGAYTISPARTGKVSETLGVSDKASRYNHNYLTLIDEDGSNAGKWYFEPIAAEGMSLSFKSAKIKLYSVGTLYATLTPYNFGVNNVNWTSSDESIFVIDNDGNYSAIAPGKVRVTAVCGDMTASCTITVSDETAFTWYSQHSSGGSDWNGEALSGIYFSSGGVRKRFMIDRYANGRDWMDEGCYLASIAMVLNNMGAKLTKGYDFRSGQSGNLPADPYTVALANAGSYGATTSRGVIYGNPILISRSNIDSRFNVGGNSISSEMTYNVSPRAIKEALDEHPEGVIVYFTRGSRTHYIVFTKCLNPSEKNPSKYRFEVCDSASSDAARGDHVPFESCISYTSEGYRMSNAVSMVTWNIK